MLEEDCRLILLTGASGSGLSTALKVLEDNGFMAVDNMPIALIDQLVALVLETEQRNLAIALDARTTGFSTEAISTLVRNLRNRFGSRFSAVYFTASHDDLRRRFNATRRQHPLAEGMPLSDAVETDLRNMDVLSPLADLHIDSSGMKPTEMRLQLLSALDPTAEFKPKVQITSFSYRRRLPEHTDLVLDMRFARNPHWQPELRGFTGLDPDIDAFLKADMAVRQVIESFRSMLGTMLVRMTEEGRPLLSIAFGCTGGRHRSVWAAETIGGWLQAQDYKVIITHREISAEN
ncbi:MAG: RNase adapter RapZ [Rhodospirillaceae bacterium]|nr:RNase adapter RapZ [Rhodospirillaceae bacterium]|tara:strand:+ start:650 stop:1522 length:873 start_codon:yes stop_codon:yes gene_type:complete